MGDVAGVSGFVNDFHQSAIVAFLARVDFRSAGIAAGVIMPETFVVFFDVADDVLFHHIRMENIVQDFEPFRSHLLDQFDRPLRVVAHVVFVSLGIEVFHADGNLFLLRIADDFLQPFDAVFQALFPTHAAAVAGKRNDVGEPEPGVGVDAFRKDFNHIFVVGDRIEPVWNARALGHRADHAMFCQQLELIRSHQVHRRGNDSVRRRTERR